MRTTTATVTGTVTSTAIRRQRGFTLIELMVVVALVAIVLTLAAPSFSNFIVQQRLKSTNAALVTDIQYARSEAVSRSVQVRMRFQPATTASPDLSCYIIFSERMPPPATPTLCDCKAAAGARCTDTARTTELRTVQLPASQSVKVQATVTAETTFAFDPRSGGMVPLPAGSGLPSGYDFAADTFIDDARRLRNMIHVSGRLKVCIPTGSTMAGDAC